MKDWCFDPWRTWATWALAIAAVTAAPPGASAQGSEPPLEPAPEAEAEPEAESEPEAEAEPEAESELEAESEPEAESEAEAEAERDPEPDEETEPRSAPDSAAATEPGAEQAPTPEATPTPAPSPPEGGQATSEAATTAEAKAATPATSEQSTTPSPAPEADGAAATAAADDDDDDDDDWGEPEPGWGQGADEAGFGNAGGSQDEAGWGDAGDDAGWGAGDDVGFGAASSTVDEVPQDVPGELSVGGFLRQMIALWTERLETQPWSRARHSADTMLRYKKPLPSLGALSNLRIVADMHFEYDFAFKADRDLYDQATLDAYESQVIGGETYIALSWGKVDLTFGRQIVAWGHGEMLSPVDIVNPRDQRDPAISELDDIRLAVLASRAGLFFDDQRLELMVIHESYFGLRAPPLSDLSPLRQLILDDPRVGMLLGSQSVRYRDVPERFDSKASQVLARYTYTGQGIDLALYAASTLDKQGVPLPPTDIAPGPDGIALELWHPRYTMLGHAGAMPSGDFVLRWELGVDIERPLSATDTTDDGFNLQLLRRTQLNWMAGFSYGGFDDTNLSLEYQQARIIDNPERDDDTPVAFLLSPENPLLALRVTRSFLRETLDLTGVATMFGLPTFRGLMSRVELTYELRDALKIGAGYAIFLPSEDNFGPFYGMDEHDRVYVTTRWDFLLD